MRHKATAPAVICLILFPAVSNQVLCKPIRPVSHIQHICDAQVSAVLFLGQFVYKRSINLFACC